MEILHFVDMDTARRWTEAEHVSRGTNAVGHLTLAHGVEFQAIEDSPTSLMKRISFVCNDNNIGHIIPVVD